MRTPVSVRAGVAGVHVVAYGATVRRCAARTATRVAQGFFDEETFFLRSASPKRNEFRRHNRNITFSKQNRIDEEYQAARNDHRQRWSRRERRVRCARTEGRTPQLRVVLHAQRNPQGVDKVGSDVGVDRADGVGWRGRRGRGDE